MKAKAAKKKAIRRQFLVALDMPEGVTVADMAGYIQDAVRVWKGHLEPECPLFDLDGESVKVKGVPQPKKKEA